MNVRKRSRSILAASVAVLLGVSPIAARADSATWLGGAGSVWSDSANWTAPFPNSATDVATFDGTATSFNPTISGTDSTPTITLDNITINTGASQAFTFTVNGASSNASLTFQGAGVQNNSGTGQQFAVTGNGTAAAITFANSASAGTNTTYTLSSGGTVFFTGTSTGGSAAFVNSSGTLDISQQTGGVTVGSISGSGTFSLGANTLTTGSDNTSQTVSGIIQDGGAGGGTGGSLVKIGSGTLKLTGTNTYTGNTTLAGGGLFIDNISVPNTATSSSLGTGTLIITSTGGATTLGTDIEPKDAGGAAIASGTKLTNNISVQGNFSVATNVDTANVGNQNFTLSGNMDLNGGVRTITGLTASGQVHFNGVVSNGGLTLIGTAPYVAFIYDGAGANTYTGLTTVGSNAFLVFEQTLTNGAVQGNILVNPGGSVDFLGVSDQIADGATVTVSSTGITLHNADGTTTVFQGFELRNNSETIGTLLGSGTVGLGSGTLTISSGGNFTGTIGDGAFGSGGNLIKTGGNTLVLSGTNTYTGSTTVNGGVLQVNGSLAGGTVTVNSGTLSGTGTINGPVTIGTAALTPGPGTSPGTLTTGTLTLNSGTTLNYQLGAPGTVGGGVNSLTIVNGNLVLDGTLNITAQPGFGLGNYRLINYTGALTDNTLVVGTAPAAGFTYQIDTATANQVNLDVTSNGQTIFWNGSVTTADGTIHGGTGTWDNATTNWTDAAGTVSGTYDGANGFFTGTAGTVTLGANIAFSTLEFRTTGYVVNADAGNLFSLSPSTGSTITTNPGVTTTINAPLTGAGSITKSGAGTLILTGASNYSGGTTLNGGALSFANTSLGTGPVTFAANSTLQWATGNTEDISTNGVTINDGITATLDTNGNNVTLASNLQNQAGGTGSGALTKIGLGTLTLTGVNTYSGGTNINAGGISFGAGSLGSGKVTFTGNSTLQWNGANTTDLTASNGITINDGVTATFDTNGNNVTFANSLQIPGGGAGTAALTKTGTGILTLGGTNTYSGATTVSTGTLRAGSTGGFSAASAFTVTTPGSLDVNGFATTIGSLAGNGTVTNTGATAGSLTAGGNNTSTTFSGTLTDGTSTLALTKTGTGTLILSGTNAYTGATTVNTGVLQVDGTLAAGSAVSVNNGATLSGSGVINGSVTIATTAALTPGSAASPGTLTVGSLTLNNNTTLNYQLGTPGVVGGGVNSLTIVNGNLILDGTLQITARSGFGLGTYELMSYTGTLTDHQLLVSSTPPLGFTYHIDTTTANVVNLDVASSGQTIFWNGSVTTADGTIHGGTGTWDTTTTNWTDAAGTVTGIYDGVTGVFAGTAGTVTLGNNIAFTTLQFSTDGYVINADAGNTFGLTPATGATITTDTGVTATINASLTGTGSVSKLGDGTLILGGANTYSGPTSVTAGTLKAGSATGFSASSAYTISSPGVLDVNGFTTSIGSLAGTGSVTNNGAVPGSLAVGANNTSTTFSGTITNGTSTLALTKVGTGTLTLTGANTYSGGTNLTSGVLSFATGSLGSGTVTFTGNSTLQWNNTNGGANTTDVSTANGIRINDGVIATLDTNGNNVAFASSLQNQVGGTGSGGLTKTGAGILTLGGTNTYSGATTVTTGTLQAGSSTGFSSTSAFTVTSPGILDINGFAPTIGSLAGSGTVINNGATSGNLTIGNDNTSTTFSGIIKDGTSTIALTKIGTGTLTLSGGNTYTGGTTLTNGGLFADANSAFGTGTLVINAPAGATLGSHISGTSIANAVSVLSNFSVANPNGDFSFGGTVNLNDANRTITGLTAAGQVHFSGGVTSTTPSLGQLTLIGGATVADPVSGGMYTAFIFDGFTPTTYTGLTTAGNNAFLVLEQNISNSAIVGNILVTAGGSLDLLASNQIADTSTVTINSTGINIPTIGQFQGFEVHGLNETIANLFGNGTVGLGGGTLTVSGGNFTGNIIDGIFGTGGNLIKNGSSTLTLGGNNTYAGLTLVNNGTLQAGSNTGFSSSSAFTVSSPAILDVNGFKTTVGSLTGDGTVTNNGATLGSISVGSDNTDTTFTGSLQDGLKKLALNKVGFGTFTVTNSTYSGATGVQQGTLQAGADGGLSSKSAYTVANGALLDINGFNTTVGSLAGDGFVANNNATAGSITTGSDNTSTRFTGSIQDAIGTLSLTKVGAGTFTVSNTSYSGATLVNAGTLQAGSNFGFSVNSTYTLSAAGTLDVNGFSTTTSSLSGAGTVTNSSTTPGFLTTGFDGTNTTFTGSLQDGAGPFGLVKTGTGIFTVTNSTYSGSTSVIQGTLQAGSATALSARSALTVSAPGVVDLNGFSNSVGSLAGDGTVTNLGPARATLTTGFDNTNTVFGGTIQDGNSTTALVKTGTGALFLASPNTFSGGTILKGGSIVILNNLALGRGDFTMTGGAFGAAGATTDIHIGGNYRQSGGELDLRVGGTTIGSFDRLAVVGSATLGGRLNVSTINGFKPAAGDSITVIAAGGGVNGQFQDVKGTDANNQPLNLTVDYLPDEVVLEFGLTTTNFAGLRNLTPNQRAVATAIDNVVSGAKANRLVNFLNALPITSIPAAFDRIAPEEYATVFQISRSAAIMQATTIENRLDSVHLAARAADSAAAHGPAGPVDPYKDEPAPPPGRNLGIYAEGSGSFVSVGDSSNATGYNFDSGGVTVGTDYRFSDTFVAGAMFNYMRTKADLADKGRLDADSFRGGIYASLFKGGAYLNAYVGGGYNDYSMRRAGLDTTVRGNTNGGEFNGLITTGYDVHAGNLTYGPVASFQYTYTGMSSLDETGSLAPLRINSGKAESTRTNIGARASYDWHFRGVTLTPEIRATWQHEFGGTGGGATSSLEMGSPNFTVTSSPFGRDSLLLNAGFTLTLSPQLGAYAFYDGELGASNYQSNNVVLGVKANF